MRYGFDGPSARRSSSRHVINGVVGKLVWSGSVGFQPSLALHNSEMTATSTIIVAHERTRFGNAKSSDAARTTRLGMMAIIAVSFDAASGNQSCVISSQNVNAT